MTHIDAHEHFLNNSKLMRDSMKKNLDLFLKLTKELIKLNFTFDEYKFSKLQAQINKLTGGWNKEWLMNKVSEFIIKGM